MLPGVRAADCVLDHAQQAIEIEVVEAQPPAGHSDVQGLCLALADWSAELRILLALKIDICRLSPAFPVIPPGLWVRTGRYSGLSYRTAVNLGTPIESM